MHLIVSGTKDAIMMVEAGANELPESIMLEGILYAHKEIKKNYVNLLSLSNWKLVKKNKNIKFLNPMKR